MWWRLGVEVEATGHAGAVDVGAPEGVEAQGPEFVGALLDGFAVEAGERSDVALELDALGDDAPEVVGVEEADVAFGVGEDGGVAEVADAE